MEDSSGPLTEHIIIVRVATARAEEDVINEIQRNLESSGLSGEAFAAPEALRQMVVDAGSRGF